MKGKITANQSIVCQLNMEIKDLSDNKDLLEEEYLRTSYNYRAQKYVNIHMSSNMDPIVKSNVERCLLFLEMPKDKQVERCLEIINNRKRNKKVREEILGEDGKLKEKEGAEEGDFYVAQHLEEKKIDAALEYRGSLSGKCDFEKKQNYGKELSLQQREKDGGDEKNQCTKSKSALCVRNSANYVDWCEKAANLRKVEATIDVEEEKVVNYNNHIFSESDVETLLLEQQLKAACCAEYDSEDKMQDLQREVELMRKLSWDDFLVWLELPWR